jgi:hypothetical protein
MPFAYGVFLKRTVKFLGITCLLLLTGILFRVVFSVQGAGAKNLFFNPQFCLGGWENPQNASGEPALENGADFSLFNKENSAYLESRVASNIFCGYFDIEAEEEVPMSATVVFNWALERQNSNFNSNTEKNSNNSNPVEEFFVNEKEIEEDSFPQETVSEEKNNEEERIILPTKEIPPKTSDTIDSLSASPQTNTEETIVPVLIEESSSTEIPQELPKEEPTAFWKLFTTAHAQEYTGTLFLDVSYSMDGIRWVSLGKVSESNFSNYSVSLPLTSWEDLKKVQIMVSIIPTIEAKPAVYLESVSLVVDYDRGVTEVVADGLEDAAGAVDSLVSTITDEWIPSLFTQNDHGISQKAELIETTRELHVIKETNLLFERAGELIKTERILPWYPEVFKEELSQKEAHYASPDITISEDKKSLTIAGSCQEKYFVILLFRNKDDYAKRPNSFAWNSADVCINNRFSYDLRSLSRDIEEGRYYLLLAEESEENPWIPISDLIPITINKITEEKILN